MKRKFLWIGAGLLGWMGVVVSAALRFHPPTAAHAGQPLFHGQTATYRYSGEVLDSGDLLVHVYFLREDDAALQAYREANLRRGYALLAQKDPRRLWVQVTFARLTPIAEARALVRETGFRADNFEIVGRSPDGRHRLSRTRVGDMEEDAARMVVPLWDINTV